MSRQFNTPSGNCLLDTASKERLLDVHDPLRSGAGTNTMDVEMKSLRLERDAAREVDDALGSPVKPPFGREGRTLEKMQDVRRCLGVPRVVHRVADMALEEQAVPADAIRARQQRLLRDDRFPASGADRLNAERRVD